MFPLRAVPGSTPWVKAQPPGPRLLTSSPGLASRLGLGSPFGRVHKSLIPILISHLEPFFFWQLHLGPICLGWPYQG